MLNPEEQSRRQLVGAAATHVSIRVFMITSEWPWPARPFNAPFIVRQVEFLRKAGVSVDVFSFRGARNPLNYMRAWLQVRKKLRQGRYDLIHAQFGQSGILAMPKRLPLVVTFRGGEVEGIVGKNGRYTLMGYVLRAVSYFVARRTDELIVVSAHVKDSLPRRSIHVIPSGLDFDRLLIIPQEEARRRLGLPQSKRLILFVGDPDQARKRYRLAREVVGRLDSQLDAELVVAWGVAHQDIPLYLNACDALLFTSMYEGSPNAVKEALACSLPVVSVAVGDVPERLRDVECCAVCADDRPETIAYQLEQVLRQQRRATNGRMAVSDLHEEVLTKRVIELYRKLLLRDLE